MDGDDFIDDLLFNESGTHYRYLGASIERTIALEYTLLFALLAFFGTLTASTNSNVTIDSLTLGVLFWLYSVFALFCYSRVVGKQAAISAHGSLIRLKYLNKVSPLEKDKNLLNYFDQSRRMPRSPLFWVFRLAGKNTSSDGARAISLLPPVASAIFSLSLSSGEVLTQSSYTGFLNELKVLSWTQILISASAETILFLCVIDILFQQKVHPNSITSPATPIDTSVLRSRAESGIEANNSVTANELKSNSD
ncbi:MAG: hypothetical protein AAGI03_03060 [Pseudomonadota bacterium]